MAVAVVERHGLKSSREARLPLWILMLVEILSLRKSNPERSRGLFSLFLSSLSLSSPHEYFIQQQQSRPSASSQAVLPRLPPLRRGIGVPVRHQPIHCIFSSCRHRCTPSATCTDNTPATSMASPRQRRLHHSSSYNNTRRLPPLPTAPTRDTATNPPPLPPGSPDLHHLLPHSRPIPLLPHPRHGIPRSPVRGLLPIHTKLSNSDGTHILHIGRADLLLYVSTARKRIQQSLY